MTKPQKPAITERESRLLRQVRVAAIVMAATMVVWVGAQFVGGQLGLPVRFAFLLDFAAIAALVWALIVTYWVRQERRRMASDPDAPPDRGRRG